MAAIQQWWYARRNLDAVYVPPTDGPLPGQYNLVWGHSYTAPEPIHYLNPDFEERIDILSKFSFMEYSTQTQFGVDIPADTSIWTPPALSSVVLTINTIRLTSNFPANVTVYSCSNDDGTYTAPLPGVVHVVNDAAPTHKYGAAIYNKEHNFALPCYEHIRVEITAVINGEAAIGKLVVECTPDGFEEGNAVFTRVLPEA